MTAIQAATYFWTGTAVALMLILFVCVREAVRVTYRYLKAKKASATTMKGPTP